ncbi:hypothetical protein [Bacteroides fluxus]|jgi:hypothetical protein|uniref:hypothetical protein n=1 Tax=Bacteroides fluxus TaxID=626930 RepID=UPI002356921C|nr:hypothetical protein [Bacteroides fluxus]
MKTKEFMTVLSTEDAQNVNGGYWEPPVIGPTIPDIINGEGNKNPWDINWDTIFICR